MKRLYLLAALLAVVLLSACDGLGTNFRLTCRSLSFSYIMPEGEAPPITVTLIAVLEATDDVLGSAPMPLTPGAHTVTINFSQTLPAGTMVYTMIDVDGLGSEKSPGVPCDAVAEDVYVPCMVSDGRVNAYHCGSPVALYCVGEGIDIYGVDAETGKGTLLIRVLQDEIEAVGIPEGANATIAQAGNVLVSRLTDGKFQLNTYYSEGKPYIITWESCPDIGEIEILAW
jgi:hypothetical protein